MITLAERLRAVRKAAKLRLGDVAARAGISVSFLSDMERGRTMPSLPVLEAIAEVFGLSVGEILVDVRIRPESEE